MLDPHLVVVVEPGAVGEVEPWILDGIPVIHERRVGQGRHRVI